MIHPYRPASLVEYYLVECFLDAHYFLKCAIANDSWCVEKGVEDLMVGREVSDQRLNDRLLFLYEPVVANVSKLAVLGCILPRGCRRLKNLWRCVSTWPQPLWGVARCPESIGALPKISANLPHNIYGVSRHGTNHLQASQ